MKLIPLSQFKKCKNRELNLFAQVDDADYEWLMKWRWQAQKEKCRDKYYAVATISGKPTKMHRLIMGATDPKITIDHVRTEETLNNQRANLRVATNLQQSWNRRKQKTSKSKYKGVVIGFDRKDRKTTNVSTEFYVSYRLNMRINGIKIRKSFKTEKAAARAYDELAKIHFGEFVNLNFP